MEWTSSKKSYPVCGVDIEVQHKKGNKIVAYDRAHHNAQGFLETDKGHRKLKKLEPFIWRY